MSNALKLLALCLGAVLGAAVSCAAIKPRPPTEREAFELAQAVCRLQPASATAEARKLCVYVLAFDPAKLPTDDDRREILVDADAAAGGVKG
jgi:hypothetical protein